MSHLPFAPRDTMKEARARRRKLRRERVDREFVTWAHTQPCTVKNDPCSGPQTFHHHPAKSAEGGSVWHDRKGIVLCKKHHQHDIVGFHALHLEAFQERYEVDVLVEIEKLNQLFEEHVEWR